MESLLMQGHSYDAYISYNRKQYVFQYVVNDSICIPKDQIKSVKKSIKRDLADLHGQTEHWNRNNDVLSLMTMAARLDLLNRIPGLTPNMRALVADLVKSCDTSK